MLRLYHVEYKIVVIVFLGDGETTDESQGEDGSWKIVFGLFNVVLEHGSVKKFSLVHDEYGGTTPGNFMNNTRSVT